MNSSVLDILEEIALPEDRVGVIMINGEVSSKLAKLTNGDSIFIYPIVVGG